jgi:predicted RNA-binding Zn-ribbon protein involved in translation (DUF1610 family)
MDDWKPQDSRVLELDLNEGSAREYAEVLELEPSVARGLHEYRNEIVHVFKFEQLLKLKGFSPENMPVLTNPSPSLEVNTALYKALGLSTDSLQPTQRLLDAACSTTKASGALLATRKGETLLQSNPSSTSLEQLSNRLVDFIRPLQEQLVLTDHGVGHEYILGFEQEDVVILPAGALYLAALQPARTLAAGTVGIWKDLASEIRRRYPPRISINNHASVSESDIAFDCPKCMLRIVVDHIAAGYSFPCPRCKASVAVPTKTTSHSSFYVPEEAAQK